MISMNNTHMCNKHTENKKCSCFLLNIHVRRANAAANAANVRVTFDPERGYPTAVYVDYVTDLVGDEVDLTITAFRRLEAAVPESG